VQRSRHAGWRYAHVAIDDHCRLAQVELRPSQTAVDCVAFTTAVIRSYNDRGTPIQRTLTDNGGGYRSHAFAALLRQNSIRPYRPRTNGKAEAFIRILQREWPHGLIYPSSSHRAKALPGWLRWYSNHRPHGALNRQPPQSRISQLRGPRASTLAIAPSSPRADRARARRGVAACSWRLVGRAAER
jgi:transposase InsO family protein